VTQDVCPDPANHFRTELLPPPKEWGRRLNELYGEGWDLVQVSTVEGIRLSGVAILRHRH
jgi:hypothetical protein